MNPNRSLVGPPTHLDCEIIVLSSAGLWWWRLLSVSLSSTLTRLRIYTNIPGLVVTMGVLTITKCPPKSRKILILQYTKLTEIYSHGCHHLSPV